MRSTIQLCASFLVLGACAIPAKVAPDGGGAGSPDGAPGAIDGATDATDAGSDADTTPPMVMLTDAPPALGNQTTVTFTYSVNETADVECRLDAQPYASCPPPSKQFTGVADGMHTFDLRATANGGQDAIPTVTFTIDTMPPALAITAQPADPSPVATAQFQFTAGDATSVTCALDGQPAVACTSPTSYAGLADGSHTFTLHGSDGAGNSATKTATWTVDTTAPSLAITTEPPNPSTSNSAQFGFTAGGATSVTCQLDAQAAAACTSPVSYAGLADGAHTFTLRGKNAAGVTTTRTYTWTIDTVPPSLAITSHPAALTSSTSAQLVFTTGDAATVTCQLDSQPAAACTSPVSYTGLADGGHTFTLRGTDAAGNAASKAFSWTVDTTPPVLAITAQPSSPSTSSSAQFAFTTGDATTVTCQLDGGTAQACTSPWPYTGLADGSHTFTLRGADAAGNAATKMATWTIDTTPPALAITSTPPANTNSTSAQLAFTAGDATTVTCQLDGAGAAACTSPVSYTGLANGSHGFTLRGTDAAGNTAMTSYTWNVDTVAPVVTFTDGPPSLTNSKTATLAFSVSEGSPICSLDLAPATACSSPLGVGPLNDGLHRLTVGATDAAGNMGQASYSWTSDATPPSVSNPTYTCDASGHLVVTWTMSDATSGIKSATCSYAGNSWDCTGMTSWSGQVSGASNTFGVEVYDYAGNLSYGHRILYSSLCM